MDMLRISMQALAVDHEHDIFHSTLHGTHLLTMISGQLQVHDIAMRRHAVRSLPDIDDLLRMTGQLGGHPGAGDRHCAAGRSVCRGTAGASGAGWPRAALRS